MSDPSAPEEKPVPIPTALDSAFLEAPFSECTACGRALVESEEPYQIQKSWRRGEVVFELALCARCAASCVREFSEESLAKMQEYFQTRYAPREGWDLCHFCGREFEADSEYELGATCLGRFLLRPVAAVCGECNAGAQENLSRKTRDAWGEFIDRTLPGVPQSLEPDTIPMVF